MSSTACKATARKVFALVDCNNFYVSCERVFAPRLAERPVVVLSNNDGCIIARSNEAKQLGIRMGTPLFKCTDLIRRHGVQVFSSNYALYGDMSGRVMATLQQFSPQMEVYSIDEAFLLLEHMPLRMCLADYAATIRRTVARSTGIPVSIGIGPTKTLAKIAGRMAKKDPALGGVCDIGGCTEIDRALDSIAAGDVWGVGHRYAGLLAQSGIRTARDLKYTDDAWVRKRMTIQGLRTVMELRGEACLALEDLPCPKKGICSSRSFGRPVERLRDLREALAQYISIAAEKLRRQQGLTAAMLVFLTTNRHRPGPQYAASSMLSLPVPTDYTPELIRRGVACLEQLYRSGYRYQKTGVFLTALQPRSHRQLHLFGEGHRQIERGQQCMRAIDAINDRWGRGTVGFAAAGIDRSWRMRRRFTSQHYTTRWSELPVAKAVPTPIEKQTF